MPPLGNLFTVMLVSLTTWSLVTLITTWLSKEENAVFRVFTIVLWTAVIIVAMAFLFSTWSMGAVAAVAASYRYMVYFAAKNREKSDDDDGDSKNGRGDIS